MTSSSFAKGPSENTVRNALNSLEKQNKLCLKYGNSVSNDARKCFIATRDKVDRTTKLIDQYCSRKNRPTDKATNEERSKQCKKLKPGNREFKRTLRGMNRELKRQ